MLPAPQGLGNNCVISPPSLGAKPSQPEVTREETAGSAPFGRENTRARRPTPAGSGPQIMCVCAGEVGVGGVQRREAGRTDSAAMPPGGDPSPSAASTRPAHLEQGLWVWERRWTQNTDTKTLARSLGRAFPNARPCLSHLTGIISEGAICPHFTKTEDQRSEVASLRAQRQEALTPKSRAGGSFRRLWPAGNPVAPLPAGEASAATTGRRGTRG